MNLFRFKNLLVWCGLALYLLTAVLPCRGLVLCFGPEGTIALEAGSHDSCECCDADDSQDHHPSDIPTGVREPCCSCFDLPIGFGHDGPQVRAATASVDLTEPAVSSQSFEAIVPSHVGRTMERTVWPPPRTTTTISHIKTIILRV